MHAQWVALTEGVLSEPGLAVAQPCVGVAPLVAGTSSAFLGLLVGSTAACGDECRAAWVRAVAEGSRRHD
jgi:hypothetical protein